MPPPGRPRAEPIGDPPRISELDSSWIDGVPIMVLASPKRESISSKRTPHVSGYRKYTIATLVMLEQSGYGLAGLTNYEADNAGKCVEKV